MRFVAFLIFGSTLAFADLSCQNGGYLDGTNCTCPSYFSGPDCSKIECINGGYPNKDGTVCYCPPGYLGVHCEAVKTSQPPENHFSTLTTFNVINFNLLTYYWGTNTYSIIQQAVSDHVTNYTYSQYNLVQTTGSPFLTSFDEPDFSSVSSTSSSNTTAESFKLDDPTDTGLYWCYAVEIFRNITTMIQSNKLKNTAISIITQHPPSIDYFEEAREVVLAFGVKINVFWISDQTFLNCSSSDVEYLKNFAELSGGIFVQLQTDVENDSNTNKIVSWVLTTNFNNQLITYETSTNCNNVPMIFHSDPNIIDSQYYFAIFGENVTTDSNSYRNCNFRENAKSFDEKAMFFTSTSPSCTSFSVKANGSCTAIVYTSDKASNNGVSIFKSYVENEATDASRYAIVEGVKFMPVVHFEPASNVSVNSVQLVGDTAPITLITQSRNMAAFEWIIEGITCTAEFRQSLRFNLTINSFETQRSIPISCLPVHQLTTTPVITTTTSSGVTSTVVPSAITTMNTDLSTEPITTTTTTTSYETTSTTPEETTVSTTQIPSTSTSSFQSSTPASCDPPLTQSVFFFAYPADMNNQTYAFCANDISDAINRAPFDYSYWENAKTDSTNTSILEASDFTTYNRYLNTYIPNENSNDILPKTHDSNALTIIEKFVTESENSVENGIILLFINRLPIAKSDLDVATYQSLTNQNIKVFAIISQSSFIENDPALGRSGAVFNKIASLANGHYIIANDTGGESSDFTKIVRKVMQFGYEQDLLASKNYGANNHDMNIGSIRVPTSSTGNLNLTMTISLPASDTSFPSRPSRLRIIFKPAENEKAVVIDALDSSICTSYSSSNFYIANFTLKAGLDRDMMIQYVSTDVKQDVLIRIWTNKVATHSSTYIDLDGNPLSSPDTVNGAALQFELKDKCSPLNDASLFISDCNGIINNKYDAKQVSSLTSTTEDSNIYKFVPYFCDNEFAGQSTCVNGAENKYDIQIVSGDYSITRSFLCQKSNTELDSTCTNKDSNGNYQCSGAAPFKRGPTKKITDCSGQGTLFYNINSTATIYSERYECLCNGGATGDSCQNTACSSPDTDALTLDNFYRTYTVVIGVTENDFLPMLIEDAAEKFNLKSLDKTYVWKYQLILRCLDGQVVTLYSGGNLEEFQNSFKHTGFLCNSGTTDLADVYSEAVAGIGQNVKGIIVFYTEDQSNFTITLDKFIQTSQLYQQQFFVYSASESEDIPLLNDTINLAAMSTGGFIQQASLKDENIQFNEKFIPNLLSNSISIAYIGNNIGKSEVISFTLEDDTTYAYIVTWKRGGDLQDNGKQCETECYKTDDTTATCKIQGKREHKITSTSQERPFDAIVYIVNEIAPSARIISRLDVDKPDAVSTSTSATRSIISIHVPNGYEIIADDPVTRVAQRTNCTYQYTSYSVFANELYQPGFNKAVIHLKNTETNTVLTRYFPFGTTVNRACVNGGTPQPLTGSCQCPPGFEGADCSLVICPKEDSKQNAWSNICVCNAIDDDQCASRYTNH